MSDNQLPRYVLRDVTLFVDKESMVGQIEELTIPKLTAKKESIRNGGMVKPRQIGLGFEESEFKFKATAFDPKLLKLFGFTPGEDKDIIAYGYYQHEDGTEGVAICEMTGWFDEFDAGDWKTGDVSKLDGNFCVNTWRLTIDGEEIADVSDFDVKIGGKSTMPSRKALLRIE